MNETFSAIEICINKIGDSALRERLSHRLQHHVRIIIEWKAHQLRLAHQYYARTELLQQLDEETVFLYIDWAMKWLPVRYREAQRDFFAKRDLLWHVSYVIRKAPIDQSSQLVSQSSSFSQSTTSQQSDVSKSEQLSSSSPSPPSSRTPYQHKTFVHVFDQCVQNGKTVLSILRYMILRLKEEFPGIKYAHIRADNAGCYHGAETLLSTSTLYKETGIWIKSMDFCDPQGGKGPCDRMAAVIKCQIRSFINQKNNCTTAVEFYKAASSTKGLEIHACAIDVQNVQKIEWPGVSNFHNIEYTSNEVRVWRSWKIGEGKPFKWSKISALKSINVLNSIFTPNQKSLWILESKTNESLESVHDQPLPSLPFQFHVLKHASQKTSTTQLKQQWAALTKKPAIQFSDKQKKYLTDKSEQGVQGMKWDPQAVALEIKVRSSSTGTPLFDHHEWLTDTQIKGFSGRLAAARRKRQSPPSATKPQRSSASQLSQSDSDEESEELDTTVLDVDEIISRVADQSASKAVLHPTTASTNIQQHKKTDISMDDIQSVVKRQHK
ncbi:unnamed protein product [Didymodactylos carnosus]|uniref:Uncharacterized protein n=1 Tax=Didymodactylos carnosus TaxID=1234261 RepID=A0A815S666_9BILA|nr:unnamed protein product [Didymodactylos carnosus]CAF1483980.1 unnamed protein product [Didymodactylos carnosus]CAF4161920.1 unnamed protein product [Didymodactylos carnosus]CAF4348377.1 unnamed protein product [Didymodactylos carnosus]